MVRSINGDKFQVKWCTKPIMEGCKAQLLKLDNWKCNHIKRSKNIHADYLAKYCVSNLEENTWFHNPPNFI